MMRCSLIIPAYNAEKSIVTCLESALNQSLARDDYEVIVVDDGSTDNTPRIAAKYPVRLIRQKNQGPAAARNKGASEAIGNVFIFTDSDCDLDYKFLEAIISPIENNKDIVGVQGTYKTKQKELAAQFNQIEIEHRYERMKKNEYIDFIGTYAAAYKRDIFKEFEGFDTEFPLSSGEDAEFSYRISEKGYKMVFCPGAFVYHTHPQTWISYFRVKFWRAYWRMLAYRKNPGKMINDSYTPQTLKIQIMLVGIIGFLLFCILLVSSKISNILLVLLFLILFVFLMTTLPFAFLSFKKNVLLCFLSPLLLLIRAGVFLAGNLSGLVVEIIISKLKHR